MLYENDIKGDFCVRHSQLIDIQMKIKNISVIVRNL